MSNPTQVVISGYASIDDARAQWANIIGNDDLVIAGINIGLGQLKPAQKEVCWVILPKSALVPPL